MPAAASWTDACPLHNNSWSSQKWDADSRLLVMNCAAPGRIGYSQHLADATSIEKMQKWGENKKKTKKPKNPPPKTKKTHHRWKNYLPDIENSFCYMNPDMCYPIKGRRVRWGGKKGNWRKKILSEKILSTAFHLFSRDRVSGEGGGMSALMMTRQGHRLNTKDFSPEIFTRKMEVSHKQVASCLLTYTVMKLYVVL